MELIRSLKKVFKDLLYSSDNKFLDVSRVMVVFTIFAFWVGVFVDLYRPNDFDPVAVGAGISAIFASGGAWIYMRKKQESENVTTSEPE